MALQRLSQVLDPPWPTGFSDHAVEPVAIQAGFKMHQKDVACGIVPRTVLRGFQNLL